MLTTGIILAGGKSSRMGTNKALLDLNGKKVIERIIEGLRPIVNNMIIVTNSFEDYEFLQLPVVEDIWKGMGPLAGIHAGLSASKTEKNLVVACDMPFVSPDLGFLLLKELSENQAVVPDIEGQLHPLFAAYRKDVQAEIEEALKSEQLRIRSFFNRIHVKILTEIELENLGYQIESNDFYNMNHPEEYHQAKNMANSRREKGSESES